VILTPKSHFRSFVFVPITNTITLPTLDVSSAVLIVGKLFISSLTTVVGYYLIVESDIFDQLSSVGGPVVVIFLTSYWMSDFFMDVVDLAATTVLHCLIADEEMFHGDQQYAEESLKKFVDKHGSVS
jgi:Plasma-membrane choline transporter